jgi:hypothetical protein
VARVAEVPRMAAETRPALPPLETPRAPWRLIFQAIGVASDPRSLILAALGLVSLNAGSAAIASVFGEARWPGAGRSPSIHGVPGWGWPLELIPIGLTAPFGLLAPFVALFRPDIPAWERLHAFLDSVWVLLVWSLFGGAIARVGVVRIARGGRVGVVSALKFALVRLGSLIAAPMAPIGVAIFIGLAGAAVGLLDRLPGPIGVGAATLLAFVPLTIGLIDAVLLLGLALGWPLMVATVVAEGEDFFDAISRSYSYVNQRTVLYAGYLLLAAVLGAVGLVVVAVFAVAALGLADWSIGLGAPSNIGFRFLEVSSVDRSELPGIGRFWHGLARAIAGGWIYSYLWSAAAILYLVLRKDVDGAEVYDIYEPIQEADGLVPEESPKPDPPTEAGSATE